MDTKNPKIETPAKDIKPAKLGRPGTITPEIESLILADLLKGYPESMAMKLHGIDENSFSRAMKNKAFRDKVNHAKSQALIPIIDKVLDSAKESAENAKWLLERRMSDDFASKGKGQNAETRSITVKVKSYDEKGKERK